MGDKTEEQIAKERDAVDAMRNAKANMTAALDRISTLELALKSAILALGNAKGYISANCYAYPLSGTSRTVHSEIEASIASAQAKLGVTAS